jgi:hypothetical protein
VQKKAVEVEEDGAGMDSASDEDDKSAVRSGQHSPIKDNGLIVITTYRRQQSKMSSKKLTWKGTL